jgi:hypothetical protein
MENFDSGRIAINAQCRQAGLVYNSPKHRGALDCLPFQGFARRSGIQVFRLYSRPSPVTDRKICGESATHLMIQPQAPKCSRPFSTQCIILMIRAPVQDLYLSSSQLCLIKTNQLK